MGSIGQISFSFQKSIWIWLTQVSFHKIIILGVVLAVASTLSKYIFVFWFYFLLLSFILSNYKAQVSLLPIFLAYLIPSELLSRMLELHPLIPWEVSKYLSLLLLLYFNLRVNFLNANILGVIFLLLVIPSSIITILESDRILKDLSFNIFGIINLSLLILFLSTQRVYISRIYEIFKVIIFGCTSVFTYVIIKTPSFSDIEFADEANFSVTAGFGSNQVSSILSLAFCLGIWLKINNYQLFKNQLFNILFPLTFLFWSLLSFSRGGVLTSVFSIIFVLITSKKTKINKKMIQTLTGLLILGSVIFIFANELTEGKLTARYLEESAYNNENQLDINEYTTGRWDILISDIEIWLDHFVLGVGVGQSAEIRPEYGHPKIAAHVEISRMLSEHGFLGFILSVLFLLVPVLKFLSEKNSFNKSLIVLCFSLAILTSFHSAMRTFITPFFYALPFIKFYND